MVTCGVDPELVNPPGLNCLNGVLKIRWQGKQPTWELVPHDPEAIYTYVGEFEFDPNADPQASDRLLSCLELDQQEIFLKTLAASLDLKKIRSFKGQRIRALLCKGNGNNGKDSLKEAVQCVYGVGVISTTMSDFHQYDYNGRKFALAKLEHARVSWSSENFNLNQLDNLQSLKAAITGETLDLELKQVQERPMTLNAVFFFNINNVPNLQASLEAIEPRYAVLSFNKTFKMNANPAKGEIEADSRFRYDPDFIRKEVVPALLNKMLAVLPDVATQAIDYSSTFEAALQEIQRDPNHLRAFCQDVGLDDQKPDSKVYALELWEVLRQWYLDNGTAIINVNRKGNEKLEFVCKQARRGDENVAYLKSVIQRFGELFPTAKRGSENGHHPTRPRQTYLMGIGFSGRQCLPNCLPRLH